MTPRPNVERPRDVQYIDLEAMRWHGNKPMGRDCTRPVRYGVDWLHVFTWSGVVVLGAITVWACVFVIAWYVRG